VPGSSCPASFASRRDSRCWQAKSSAWSSCTLIPDSPSLSLSLSGGGEGGVGCTATLAVGRLVRPDCLTVVVEELGLIGPAFLAARFAVAFGILKHIMKGVRKGTCTERLKA